MTALILNSGVGRRMGDVSLLQPKCMTRLCNGESLISRQLYQLESAGIKDVVITTGPFAEALQAHIQENVGNLRVMFVPNPEYEKTNYIYSIFLARHLLVDDILLLHGDLVFDSNLLVELLRLGHSAVCVDSQKPLPQKDFKAVLLGSHVKKVGVDFFEYAVALQPLYMLLKRDWVVWLKEIESFVGKNITGVYAENALNQVGDICDINAFELDGRLCEEVDTLEDLARVDEMLCGS